MTVTVNLKFQATFGPDDVNRGGEFVYWDVWGQSIKVTRINPYSLDSPP